MNLTSVVNRDFKLIEQMAREKAIAAIHRESPVAAREWTEVAAVAAAASRGEWPRTDPESLARFLED